MSLLKNLELTTDLGAVEGSIPLTNLYTAGVAGERFLRALKDEGTILATRCAKCEVLYVPGRLFCERCFARLEEWRQVGPRGKVVTFTTSHVGLDGKPLAKPDLLAVIAFEGTTGGLVHRLGDVEPEKVAIGMNVEPVLRPAKERKGSINDIVHFRPAK